MPGPCLSSRARAVARVNAAPATAFGISGESEAQGLAMGAPKEMDPPDDPLGLRGETDVPSSNRSVDFVCLILGRDRLQKLAWLAFTFGVHYNPRSRNNGIASGLSLHRIAQSDSDGMGD